MHIMSDENHIIKTCNFVFIRPCSNHNKKSNQIKPLSYYCGSDIQIVWNVDILVYGNLIAHISVHMLECKSFHQ